MIQFTDGGINTITLPDPQLGDSDQYNIKTKFKLSMTGEVHSYFNTPDVSKLLLTFVNLKPIDVSNLKTFLQAVVIDSQVLLEYTDYNNDKWDGYIVANPFDFSQNARRCPNTPRDDEASSITLEFEGVPQ